MAEATETEITRFKIESRRSAVRVWVTYGSIGAYLVFAGIVIGWLMWAGNYEVAVGVLSGVAALAGSISGFWFGARSPSNLNTTTAVDDADESTNSNSNEQSPAPSSVQYPT